MNFDVRWFLIWLSNLLLIALTAEINHYLAAFSVHLFIGGLLMTFAVLRLRLRQGLLTNGLTALAIDALNPLPFGRTFLLFLICHTFVFSIRGHFAREQLRSGAFVAAGMNIFLFLSLTVLAGQNDLFNATLWQRVAVDGGLSAIAVMLIAPWFLSLQKSALAFAGIDLDAEQREAQ